MKNKEMSDLKIIVFALIPTAVLISFIQPKDDPFKKDVTKNIPSYQVESINSKYVKAGLSEKEAKELTNKTFRLFEKK